MRRISAMRPGAVSDSPWPFTPIAVPSSVTMLSSGSSGDTASSGRFDPQHRARQQPARGDQPHGLRRIAVLGMNADEIRTRIGELLHLGEQDRVIHHQVDVDRHALRARMALTRSGKNSKAGAKTPSATSMCSMSAWGAMRSRSRCEIAQVGRPHGEFGKAAARGQGGQTSRAAGRGMMHLLNEVAKCAAEALPHRPPCPRALGGISTSRAPGMSAGEMACMGHRVDHVLAVADDERGDGKGRQAAPPSRPARHARCA